MKKIISIILLITSFCISLPSNVYANEETYFVVTAYYSPLPNQNYYLKGNYADEIRLNGKWIAWASWKWVFSWMLAAPKSYSFGTKIYLEWLWIWSVEDRWWAIVSAWNRGYSYDRIDVWMWYWDEGLKRALNWWKRTVKWSIISSDSQVTLDYTTIWAPSTAVSWLVPIPTVFNKSIWVKSSSNDIYELKLFLSDNKFYNWSVDSIYSNDLISLIHNFQLNNNIIRENEILWAWYWGKNTRAKFLEAYRWWNIESHTSDKNEILSDNINIELNNNYENIILKWNINDIFNNPVKSIAHIAELQNILIELELYNWEVDAQYDSIQDTILNYQLSKEIITNKDSLWAGYYWPVTRKTLYNDYIELLKYKEKIKEAELLVQNLEEESLLKAEEKITDLWNLVFWNISPEVRDLQLILNHFWYFNNSDTAIFWDKTKEAIIALQLDREVIESQDSVWAWIFWPSTKEELTYILSEYYFQEDFESLEIEDDLLIKIEKTNTL